MRTLVAGGIASAVLAVSAAAVAQPGPQPQPQPQPWYRMTLNDGRVVDVQVVGGDATSYHVQMSGAVYSLPRANVVSSIALVPASAPPPPPVAQPIRDDKDPLARNPRVAGWVWFGAAYLITVPIALARSDNDSSANAGLIPVVGPLIWTLSGDDNDAFEDGWDWLAAADGLIQGLGLYLIISGGKDSSTQQTVRLVPVSGRGQHGFAIGGTF